MEVTLHVFFPLLHFHHFAVSFFPPLPKNPGLGSSPGNYRLDESSNSDRGMSGGTFQSLLSATHTFLLGLYPLLAAG
jgi:hypothetical protein